MKLSVFERRLGDAEQHRGRLRRLAPCSTTFAFPLRKSSSVHLIAPEQRGVARSVIFTLRNIWRTMISMSGLSLISTP